MKEARIIRSFVRRRQQWMTPRQAKGLETSWTLYGLTLEAGFLASEAEEYILEIGFGMGQSLAIMAQQNPEKKFIGVEVHKPGVGALLAEIKEQQINNIQIFNNDVNDVLKQCIKDESLSKVQIFFPDPWPKKRHHKRRLIQADFIKILHLKLKPGGLLHLATDWQNYAEQMLAVLEGDPNFINSAGEGKFLPHRHDRPMTKFERRGLNLGHDVWDLLYQKK